MSVCVGELVRRASTAATRPCCQGRHLFLTPPACECRCGERVRHAGAASVRGERMRRRAGAAASGCCMRVLRERVRLSHAPGVRVPLWREGAACGCCERARRAYEAASGCSCERVLHAGAARASAAGA